MLLTGFAYTITSKPTASIDEVIYFLRPSRPQTGKTLNKSVFELMRDQYNLLRSGLRQAQESVSESTIKTKRNIGLELLLNGESAAKITTQTNLKATKGEVQVKLCCPALLYEQIGYIGSLHLKLVNQEGLTREELAREQLDSFYNDWTGVAHTKDRNAKFRW